MARITPAEDAIARAAGVADIRTATFLNFRNLKGVRDLSPLALCEDLQSIYFAGGTLKSLDVLADLPKLKRVVLLEKARVKDASALARFPALEELIVAAAVQDIVGVPLRVPTLTVAYTRFSDPASLAAIAGVRDLTIGTGNHYAPVGDDARWPDWPQVERLELLSRTLTTTANLAPLTGLTRLYAAANRKLRSLDGLEGMTRLEVLAVFRTNITTLAPVSGHPLRVVFAGFCPLKAIGADLGPALTQLDLHDSRLTHVDELASATGLERLSLTRCSKLKSLAGLTGHPSLQTLMADEVPVTDWSPLTGLPELEYLDVSGTTFDDVDIVASLPKLQVLGCRDAAIAWRRSELEARCPQVELHSGRRPSAGWERTSLSEAMAL